MVVESLRVAQEVVHEEVDGDEGGQEQGQGGRGPHAPSQGGGVQRLASEAKGVGVEGRVEDGGEEGPDEGLGDEGAAGEGAERHGQGQDAHVEHGHQVVVLAHDALHDVVRRQVLRESTGDRVVSAG